jgi:DNA-directed RNA polymerase subunit RPC12/RpoP
MIKSLKYDLDLNKMSWHSQYYCPNCQSKNLMVDNDEKCINHKPYAYYCRDCGSRFIIEQIQITKIIDCEGKKW